jgi:hypothetical protein
MTVMVMMTYNDNNCRQLSKQVLTVKQSAQRPLRCNAM